MCDVTSPSSWLTVYKDREIFEILSQTPEARAASELYKCGYIKINTYRLLNDNLRTIDYQEHESNVVDLYTLVTNLYHYFYYILNNFYELQAFAFKFLEIRMNYCTNQIRIF